MCGEKALIAAEVAFASGSPPRVRGEVFLCDPAICHPRITPACAGRSYRESIRNIGGKDHPRVCGEKFRNTVKSSNRPGSPPRVRGEVKETALEHCKRRITPACAGRSVYSAVISRRLGDHPRVCGEKLNFCSSQVFVVGSPPRVRGEDVDDALPRLLPGITPACAGRRHFAWSTRSATRDHPRVCGEKHFDNAKKAGMEGSPPRVRGEGNKIRLVVKIKGITPACAGRRLRFLFRFNNIRDHPRVCGEK